MAGYSDRYYKSLYRQQNMPSISLGGAGFTPATFTPMVYTPREFDVAPLQRSLAQLDERKEQTDKQRSAIRLAFDQLKMNEAEDEFKQNYINDVINKIDTAAQFGDYSAALEEATSLASSSLTDPRVTGRVRAEEQYQKELQLQQARRDKGEISQATYNWWAKKNPYSYQDKYDNKGNVIGGTSYDPSFRPVNDINWASAAMAAFKLISPFKSSVSTDGGTTVTNNTGAPINRNGNIVDAGVSTSSTGHSSQTQEKVTKEQITERIEELLSSSPDGYRQAEQAYDVAIDEFKGLMEDYKAAFKKDPYSDETKNLGQKLDARKKLMYRNGSPIDYKEYYSRMITDNLYAEGLAYDWKTSSSGGTSSYGISDRTGVGSGSRTGVSDTYFPGARYNPSTGLWEGPMVKQENNADVAEQEVVTSSNNIGKRFKK